MELKNGIIIDGEIHECVKSDNFYCNSCSLQQICEENFYHDGICKIFENSKSNYKFVNRGKVKDE